MMRPSETRDRLAVVAGQVGGPTPAAEVADALADPAKGAIHHFSGVPDVCSADFAREILVVACRKVVVEDIPTLAYPTPAKRPANSRLDCSGLARDFGIERPKWIQVLGEVIICPKENPV